MKKLPVIIAVIGLLATTLTGTAQTFSIKAGLTFANLHSESDGPDSLFDQKLKHGYQLGAMAEFPLSERLAIETGLIFSTKGYRIKEDIESGFGPSYEYKGRLELLYVEVPIQLTGTCKVGKLNFFGTFGPYLGYGIYGRFKDEFTIFGETETTSDDVKWGNDKTEDFIKRLDYGLTAGAGVDLNKFRIGLSYSYGLANISSFTDGNTKVQNRVIGIAVSYRFKKNVSE
ncbi:MAG: PorT family protein [Bacteroidota bacterium]|nr:PorT family protein [Bacteroidota bacterium]